jgi:hypothetical protein
MRESNAIQIAQHDEGCSSGLAVNDAEYGDTDVFDFDPEAEFLRQAKRAEEILEHQIADFENIDPSKPRSGKGPTVYIGFDSEFVSGIEEVVENAEVEQGAVVSMSKGTRKRKVKQKRIRHDNKVLSLQFYLIGENQRTFTRVINLRDGARADRPNFNKVIVKLINDAMDAGAVLEWPEQIVLCGFFLRIDLPAFGDFSNFKHDLQNVGGKVSGWSTVTETPEENADMKSDDEEPVSLRPKSIVANDRDGIFRTTKVRFVDVGSHVEMGTSLAQIGDLLELPKLTLPEGYVKDRMDLLQKDKLPEFESYGLRDSEIAVRFFLRLQDFAIKHLKPIEPKKACCQT